MENETLIALVFYAFCKSKSIKGTKNCILDFYFEKWIDDAPDENCKQTFHEYKPQGPSSLTIHDLALWVADTFFT